MQRQQFSSGLTTLLAMAGAAIGLGNVWRFPYMMATYGGAAFFIVYLLFVISLAVPALVGEWGLGRETRGGTIKAFTFGLGPRRGRILGYLLVVGMLIANSYYLVIIGNIVYSTYFSLFRSFGHDTLPDYVQGLQNGTIQFFCSLLVLLAVLYVSFRGVNKGIERVSSIFVPLFFLVILYLIFATLRLDGAVSHMWDFMRPDFSRLTATSVFAALGQAAFTVGLGGTLMVVYGSYMPNGNPLVRSSLLTVFSDTFAAVLVALFIFPTLLVFGLSMESGPKLIFVTLPHLFEQMLGGRVLGSLFFLALLSVAFLSGLAALEVVIASISDDQRFNRITRNKALVIFGLLELGLMAFPAFNPELIAVLDMIFGSGMLALGSLIAILVFGWCINRSAAMQQISGGSTHWLFRVLYYWLRVVVPLMFIIIIIGFTWEAIAG